MYHHSGQKRPLIRSHSHGGPMFRSLPLFGFLFGLVVFFYIIYIYLNKSNELTELKNRFSVQNIYMTNLKNENVDLTVKIDSLTKQGESYLNDKSQIINDLEVCSKNLISAKAESEEKGKNFTTIQNSLSACSTREMELRSQVHSLEELNADLRKQLGSSQTMIKNLNSTIETFQSVNKNVGDESKIDKNIKPKQTITTTREMKPLHDEEKMVGLQDILKAPEVNDMNVEKDNVKINSPKLDVLHSNDALPQGLEIPKTNEQFRGLPERPGDRVKMEMNKGQMTDDGKLIVPGGEYADGDGVNDNAAKFDAAPDFENDEKRLKEPDN